MSRDDEFGEGSARAGKRCVLLLAEPSTSALIATGAAKFFSARPPHPNPLPAWGEGVLLPLLLLLLSACSVSAKGYGEQLYNDPAFAGSKFNAWSCATCHATKDGEARLLSGHPLGGATKRPSYWGGNSSRLIDAASFCYVYFMRGAKAFAPDEPRSRALYEYLASLEGSTDAKPLTFVPNVADVPRGDAARDEAVYASACQECPGAIHTGSGRNSELANVLPEVKDEYAQVFPGVPARLVFIEKVRHGQFFAVGGNMPPFALERMSDEDLGALLEYLGL